MNDNTKKSIEELLHGEHPDSRRQAAEDLSGCNETAVVEALAAALKDKDKGVRDAASQALLTLDGDRVAHAIVGYIAEENIVIRNLAGDMLHRLGAASVSSLLPYIQKPDHDVRKFAIDLLALVGTSDTALSILSCLSDPDENVVVAAVEALGDLRNPETLPHLMNAYAVHPFARPSVVDAIGKIGGPEALRFLRAKFGAVDADAVADPVLLCTLVDSLGRVGDEHALADLQQKVPSVKGKLRHVLLHAVGRITERVQGATIFDEKYVRDLCNMLAEDDAEMKSVAVKGLAAFPGHDITRALLQSFGVNDELDSLLHTVLGARDEALGVAVDALLEQEPAARKHSVRLIGHLANRMIQQAFTRQGCEFDEGVLTLAFERIQSLWGEGDHETRAAIVEALFRLDGDKTIGFFQTLMEDPDPWLRIAVIEYVTAVADRRVPMFVNHYLDDEDPMVREAAMSMFAAGGEAIS
jgi:HEAT repeat protein